MNVQIQEIKSIFNSINEYPETKDGLKKAFNFFGERVIGIVNSEYYKKESKIFIEDNPDRK
jgi:hypothetical protein